MSGRYIYDPVDLTTLLLSDRIVAGDTIVLLSDKTTEDITIPFSGNLAAKVTIKSLSGIRKINGGAFTINGSNLRFEYCEFYFSNWIKRQAEQEDNSDIDLAKVLNVVGHDVEFYRCIIHDFTDVSWWAHVDNVNSKFSECLIYYNGWNGTTRGHGYNFYTQNNHGRKQLERCILFSSFRNNLHINAATKINSGYDITDCVLFNAGTPSAIPSQVNEVIIGSGIGECFDFNFLRCEMFGDSAMTNAWGIFGGYQNPINTLSVKDSYIDMPDDITIIGESVHPETNVIEDNYLYGQNTLDLQANFPNNTFGSRPISGKRVRTIKCDGDRGYVVIYNYDLDNTVDVDLTGILVTGDNYMLINVQDKDVDIVTGIVGTNNIISVAMTGRTIAAPILTDVPPSSFPLFGCFIIEKVV